MKIVCVALILYCIFTLSECQCPTNQWNDLGTCRNCNCAPGTTPCVQTSGECLGGCSENHFGPKCGSLRAKLLTAPTITPKTCSINKDVSFKAWTPNVDEGDPNLKIGRYVLYFKENDKTQEVSQFTIQGDVTNPVPNQTVFDSVNISRFNGSISFAVRADFVKYYSDVPVFDNGSITGLVFSSTSTWPCEEEKTTPSILNFDVKIKESNLSITWTPSNLKDFNIYVNVTQTKTGDCETLKSLSTNLVPGSSGAYLFQGNYWSTYDVEVSVQGQTTNPLIKPNLNTIETVPTGKVSSIVVTEISQTSGKIAWTAPPCAERGGALVEYILVFREVSSNNIVTPTLSTSPVLLTSVTASGLVAGKVYSVTVQYKNSKGTGPTQIRQFTTLALPTTQPPPVTTTTAGPLSPSNLRIVEMTKVSVKLSWSPPSGLTSISRYEIFYWNSKQSESSGKLVTASTTTQEITSLTSGETYIAKVRAVNTNNIPQDYSNIITFRTNFFSVDSNGITETTAKFDWSVHPGDKTISRFEITCVRQEAIDSTSTFTGQTVSSASSSSTGTYTGLTSGSRFLCTLKTVFSDNTNTDMVAQEFWTRPAAITVANLKSPTVQSITNTSITVLVYPLQGYVRGKFDSYYVAYVLVTSRRKRAVPANSVKVHESTIPPATAGTPVTIGDSQATSGLSDPPLQSGSNYRVFAVYKTTAGTFDTSNDVSVVGSTSGQTPITVPATTEAVSTTASPATGIPVWAIVLIVLLLILLLALLIFLLVYFLYLRKRKNDRYIPNHDKNIVKIPLETGDSCRPKSFNHWSDIEDVQDSRFMILDVAYGKLDVTLDSRIYIQDRGKKTIPFIMEYSSLPISLTAPCTVAMQADNVRRNRDHRLVVYDNSRVPIISYNATLGNGAANMNQLPMRYGDTLGQSDYYNACFVDGYFKRKAYIAAQSPLVRDKEAIRDFWLIIYQQNVGQIVTLNSQQEDPDAFRFWPKFDPINTASCQVQYGPIHVTILEQYDYAHYTLHKLEVSNDDDRNGKVHQQVLNFQFKKWPRKGVPDSTLAFLDLYTAVKIRSQMKDGPLLVHCETGVGQTAVFIALDSLLQQAYHENVVNVYRFCAKMRRFRPSMVNFPHQYMFIYDLLFDKLQATNSLININVRETYVALSQINPHTNKTFMWEHHCILEKYTPPLNVQSTFVARKSPNNERNRYNHIVAADPYRVLLRTNVGEEYINAIYLDGLILEDDMIVTQTPQSKTLRQFWSMLEQEQVTCVVDMQKESYGIDDAVEYYPDDAGMRMDVGYGIQILCTKVCSEHNGCIIVRHVKVFNSNSRNDQERNSGRLVTIYQLADTWEQYNLVPKNRKVFIHLIQFVLQERLSGPLVIHCLDGATRSGLFAACVFACQKITHDQYVDIFQIVKDMKTRRSQILAHLDQYKFMYKVLWDWVQVELAEQIQEAIRLGSLPGHLPATDKECIYSHAQTPVLHAHELPSWDDLGTLDFSSRHPEPHGTLEHQHNMSTTLNSIVHYQYAGDLLKNTM